MSFKYYKFEDSKKQIKINLKKYIYFFIEFLLFSFIATFNLFAEIEIRKQDGLFCYDGDTCYVQYGGKKDKIRLLELDTPEINNSKCEKEYILGIKARDYINELISNSYKIEFISDYKRDYFGRILTYMFIDGENVSKTIVSNELGVIYDKNNKPNWCE